MSELEYEGVGPEARPSVIDDVLADVSWDRGRELLLNPELLGVAAELHLRSKPDDDGRLVYVIEHDGYLHEVREPEDLLPLLDRERVERLGELAREALLARLPSIA